MSIGEIIYTILIRPLLLLFEVLFMLVNNMIDNPGLSIIALSLAMNFLVLPLYRRADAMQEEEREMEARLHKGVAHIKKVFKGDERMMMLQTYYRQNNYKPTYVLKGSVSLFLEIPFFIAAYQFLSHLELLEGCAFGVISDLGAQDALISVGGMSINLLPVIMTAVNLISCVIFTKGYPVKTKVQLYSMAVFFFFFLYKSPAGLVFYWTLNNIFSLVKTIFYKLKNPGKVLKILFACAGAVLFVYGVGFFHTKRLKDIIFVTALGILLMLPLIVTLVKKHCTVKLKPDIKTNGKTFFAGAIYMAVLAGAVIPSSVIVASPQEFADINYYVNPVWYVWSALCYAVGTFIVWVGVFYGLASPKNKKYFELGIWILSGIATLDYMFFGKNWGVLSNTLRYEVKLDYSRPEQLKNIGIVLLVMLVLVIIYRFVGNHVPQILMIASLAFVVMSGNNMIRIHKSVSELSEAVEAAKREMPSFSLSKNGKNVVVLMLDRAMGQYVPYFMNEKPELAEKFSGFTYYSNVVSFGAYTNFASSALFGGYEYTPFEMNKRDTEPLKDKHNEALKIMPVLFDENGYDVTVCDPVYANYQWTSDLSIYDEYPDIDTYITAGKFADKEGKLNAITNRKRNFFCYSIMKMVPECMQSVIYDNGNYNHGVEEEHAANQVMRNLYVADGINESFMNCYTTLQNLSGITEVNDSETNTFLMMTNDLTHEPMLLQEPEYVPMENVDNTKYEELHSDRYTVDGKTLSMEKDFQQRYYQTNMAALLQIAEWLDYMKENDVYDNTRIIIVADHGRDVQQLEELILDDGSNPVCDAEFYYPLLMVKDFGDGEFATSEEFMTNADVATLAFDGLIDNPVNPFTGKVINNSEKTAHDQYILGSEDYDVSVNNGNVFLPGMWLSIHDNIHEKSNWTILNQNAVSPFE